MKIFEGLKEGDLSDLVLPIVSIDEFEAKLDDQAIVVGFYVMYLDPARDLNAFIQKSSIDFLDTEVSSAPTEDGYYLVFIEITRNNLFPSKLMAILESLVGLTGIKEWSCKLYDHDTVVKVEKETLQTMLRLEPEPSPEDLETDTAEEETMSTTEPTDEALGESILSFFNNSILDDLVVENHSITMTRGRRDITLNVVDFGTIATLSERYAALKGGMRLDEDAQYAVSKIEYMLGNNYLVEHLKNMIVISSSQSSNILLIAR